MNNTPDNSSCESRPSCVAARMTIAVAVAFSVVTAALAIVAAAAHRPDWWAALGVAAVAAALAAVASSAILIWGIGSGGQRAILAIVGASAVRLMVAIATGLCGIVLTGAPAPTTLLFIAIFYVALLISESFGAIHVFRSVPAQAEVIK